MVAQMEPKDLLEKLNQLKDKVMNIEQETQEKSKNLEEERIKSKEDNAALLEEALKLNVQKDILAQKASKYEIKEVADNTGVDEDTTVEPDLLFKKLNDQIVTLFKLYDIGKDKDTFDMMQEFEKRVLHFNEFHIKCTKNQDGYS